MDNYFTYTALLGLRDSNLPLSKELRIKRFESVQKMVNLIEIAKNSVPTIPVRAFNLDLFDPEWDDLMPFPVVDYTRYFTYVLGISGLFYFYSYNYNTFTHNIRFRTFRNCFPLLVSSIFAIAYASYRQQILKINLFDEYCWLRTQQLVKQNEYLLQHQDFKKFVWWRQDFKQTLGKVYRQANNHDSSDFKDSELLLQDFINRYIDPTNKSPMKQFSNLI